MQLDWTHTKLTEGETQRIRNILEPTVADIMKRAQSPEERALLLHAVEGECGLSVWLLAGHLKREANKEET